MRRAGYRTLLDPFENRYGKQVTVMLYIPALLGEVFWSAAILVALGTTFETILGFNPVASILVSAAVVMGYTLIGGAPIRCLYRFPTVVVDFRRLGCSCSICPGSLWMPVQPGKGIWLPIRTGKHPMAHLARF